MPDYMSAPENVVTLGCDKQEAAIRPLSNAEIDTTSGGLVGAAILFFAGYGLGKFGEDQGWW